MTLRRGISRRTLAAAAVALPFVAPRVSSHQVESTHSFWSSDGRMVIEDASLSLFSSFDGDLRIAAATFTPTEESNYEIMQRSGKDKASHVDISFSFFGLVPSDRASEPILGKSEHIRVAGAELVHGDHTVFIARCFNIEGRWVPNKEITVTAAIRGYVQDMDFPWVVVEMQPCWYSEVDVPEGSDPIPGQVFQSVTGGIDKRYTRGSIGEPLQLLDRSGHSGFLFP